MATYDSNHVKNIALLGHAGSGKTTLAESMLFDADVIKRRGSVSSKNTVSDYHELELERGSSVFSSLMPVSYTHLDVYKRQDQACEVVKVAFVEMPTILRAKCVIVQNRNKMVKPLATALITFTA